MTSFFREILKDIPPELPSIIKIIDYSSSKISIVRIENAFSKPNTFEKYKFLLPLHSSTPIEIIDKKTYQLEKKNIFPVNPGQSHCSKTNSDKPIISVHPIFSIFIEKEYLQDTARLLYGKNDVFFENNNFKINKNLQNLFNIFIEEATNKQTGYQFILENLNLQIVINLLRTLNNNCYNEKRPKNYFEKRSIRYVIEYMEENYNQEFTIEDIAMTANYSTFHFIRIFKAETGKTPFEYLLDIKVDKAKHLLENTDQTITDICFASGFNNRSHFSVVFKKKTGYSPSQYRKINQS